MNQNTEIFLNSHSAGELYRALRLSIQATDYLVLYEYKPYIDLVIEIIHKKVSPFFCALVNTEFIGGKISLEEASIKLDYFEKIYNI